MTLTSVIAGVAVAVLIFLVLRASSRSGDSDLPDADLATEADLRTLIMAGRKIDAIKVYRRLHRVDLKAAKDAVERMADELGPLPGPK